MSDLTLTFLGIPGVERDGRPVALARHKALALLAYLAVTGAPHRRDVLATVFWPGWTRPARAALRRPSPRCMSPCLGTGWRSVAKRLALRRRPLAGWTWPIFASFWRTAGNTATRR
ncbi:MAG: hypothetical protein HZY76_00105 [Anaerolineae bacterium]|nr:MAG: hypothetical protein HZY76_00105 [Anaerolineae bacterium]